MFFFTKSVMSRIDPLVTASPMFCESRTGMSKFVLCAANCVKIASCHCAFGTVLTLIVTFGRVFVYSLPSASSAWAGGHSNHRNVSVIGLFESLLVASVAAVVAPPPPLSPPHAATSAAQTATSAAETVSLPFIAPPPRGLVLLRLPAALRTLHEACKNLRPLCIPCQLCSQFLALPITLAYPRSMVIAPERSRFPVFDPADGSIIETVDSASPEDGIAAVDAAAQAASDWATRAPRERAEILRKAFDLMTSRLDEIAGLIVREMGKPFVEARGEASYAA